MRLSSVYSPVIFSGASAPRGSRPTGPGSQPRMTKKTRMSTRPSQNDGSAIPIRVMPRTEKSKGPSRLAPASTPKGTPITMAKVRDTRASSTVAGSRSHRSLVTGRPVMVDSPRSPWARSARKTPYCSGIDLSKPNSTLILWRSSSSACGGMYSATGSGANTLATRKVSVTTPKTTGATSRSRVNSWRDSPESIPDQSYNGSPGQSLRVATAA